jgi:DNA-binding NarL/FixJ family response regulator
VRDAHRLQKPHRVTGESGHAASLRVVLADDHSLYRASLAGMLRASGFDVVHEAANGDAAIRATEELAPDMLVMDLNMPGMSGLDAIRRVVRAAPATRVLVLSVSAQEADVATALLAGAGGYVLKDRTLDEIGTAIRTVAAGGTYVSPGIGEMPMRSNPEPAD